MGDRNNGIPAARVTGTFRRVVAIAFRLLPSLDARKAASDFRLSRPRVRKAVAALTYLARHRDLLILTGPAAGLRINLGGSHLAFVTGTAERPVQRAIAEHLRPGDVAYDIGANIGFFTLLMARLAGPEGAVYAFEPVRDNVVCLQHNLEINALHNVTVVPEAAARATGTARMLMSRWSTFHHLEDALRAWREPAASTQEVRTRSLDDFRRAGAPPPALVKIDAEGSEAAVLGGMAETLHRDRPILICEHHGDNLPYIEIVRSAGYSLHLLGAEGKLSRTSDNTHTVAFPVDPHSDR